MNDLRIRAYADELFKDDPMTDAVREQKEALVDKLTKRVKASMAEGYTFDRAFDIATSSVLTGGALNTDAADSPRAFPDKPTQRGIEPFNWKVIALSPFIYIALGVAFGWWAWAWMIIPVSGIFFAPMPAWVRSISLTPFIYIALGMLFGWWTWGWIIIPVSAILFVNESKKKNA